MGAETTLLHLAAEPATWIPHYAGSGHTARASPAESDDPLRRLDLTGLDTVAIGSIVNEFDALLVAGSAPLIYLRTAEVCGVLRAVTVPRVLGIYFPFEEVEFYAGPGEARTLARRVGSMVPHCDHVVVPSRYARADLARWVRSARHVEVVPLGADFAPNAVMPMEPRRVVVVSRSGPLAIHKNLSDLVGAFVLARRKVPDLRLDVIGDVDRSLSKYEGLRLLGNLSELDRQYELSGAGFSASASGIEAFGLSIAEAMRAGVPVVAARAGAVPELITHERSGLLVDSSNRRMEVNGRTVTSLRPDIAAFSGAMCRLAQDRELRFRLSHQSCLETAQLTWEACARRYLEALFSS